MPASPPPSSPTYATISNIGLSAIILVTLGIWCYGMFGQKSRVPVDKSAVAKEVFARLDANSATIKTEAQQLVAEITPPLTEAIYQQAQKDSSLYLRTLRQQGETYAQNADEIFVDAVKAEYRDYLQRHRQVIAEEFPDYADDESLDRLIAHFEQAGEGLIERYYLDDFANEAERTQLAWSKIQPLEPPSKDDPSLEEQLLEYGADWSVLAFTDEAKQQVVSP